MLELVLLENQKKIKLNHQIAGLGLITMTITPWLLRLISITVKKSWLFTIMITITYIFFGWQKEITNNYQTLHHAEGTFQV